MTSRSVSADAAPPPPDAIAAGFREAMRRLAASVTVVTAAVGGERHGLTATAVCSLSMDPPALIVCINRSSRLHNLLAAGTPFSVNVLGQTHAKLAAAFGSSAMRAERFADGGWSIGQCGTPLLEGACATVRCVVDATVPYGSHSVVIGRVVEASLGSGDTPLVFHDGRFGRVTRDGNGARDDG